MFVLDGARTEGCVISKSINTATFYYLVAGHRREGGFDGKDPDLSGVGLLSPKVWDYPVLQKQEICSAWQTRSTEHPEDTIFGFLLSDFLLCLQNYVIRN
jgi:hypothetical protein